MGICTLSKMDLNDFEDQNVWDLICSGKTKGVFQLESNLGRHWAKQLKPRSISELSALISLIRPGCISGDTKITVSSYIHKDGNVRFVRKTMKELFINKDRYYSLFSIDKDYNLDINRVSDIFYSGQKECFKVLISKRPNRKKSWKQPIYYDLECTKDHKLLRSDGEWVELQHLKLGDRIAILKKQRKKLVANRQAPSADKVENARLRLPQSNDIEWAEYVGCESVGIKDTYDITMDGPNHNFMAGGIVVHNCLKAYTDGKSMTQHYVDRKSGKDPTTFPHDSLSDILNETYGVLVYQEQSMIIAQKLAGFSLQEADVLRKAIGKKKADLMEKVKKSFIEGAINKGIVSKELAEEIFSWIEKSSRYSFNKCLSPETIVITPSGEKPMNDIKVGDAVLAPNHDGNEFVEVLDIIDNGDKETVEITLEDSKTITCTIDHKFLCSNGQILPLYEILENNLEIMCIN